MTDRSKSRHLTAALQSLTKCRFPRLLCRGLIEAGECRWGEGDPLARSRGSYAAASLKLAGVQGRSSHGCARSRGSYAAASLKQEFELGGVTLRGMFPRLLCRGLIEAGISWHRRKVYSGFPRLLCRGLIEASPAMRTSPRLPRFPRLLCRGLIEAMPAMDIGARCAYVPAALMPRPH